LFVGVTKEVAKMALFDEKSATKQRLFTAVTFFKRYKMQTVVMVVALVFLVAFCFIQSGALWWVHDKATGLDNNDVAQKGLLGVGLTGFYVFIFALVAVILFAMKVRAAGADVRGQPQKEEVDVRKQPQKEEEVDVRINPADDNTYAISGNGISDKPTNYGILW
jgi:hypothetical protein